MRCMTHTQIGLIIGGVLPAILFGISGFVQKISANQNITTGAHLVAIGVGVVIVGLVVCLCGGGEVFTIKKVVPSLVIGAAWGCGMLLVTIALMKYNASLAAITPLYNMNTLITVIVALVFFAEWKDANIPKLLIGTVLITVGGIFVSTSTGNKEKSKQATTALEMPKVVTADESSK